MYRMWISNPLKLPEDALSHPLSGLYTPGIYQMPEHRAVPDDRLKHSASF